MWAHDMRTVVLTWECVQLGRQPLGPEILEEFSISCFQTAVEQFETAMDADKGRLDVQRTAHFDEALEAVVRLKLTRHRVQEWRRQHVHALNVAELVALHEVSCDRGVICEKEIEIRWQACCASNVAHHCDSRQMRRATG